MSRSRCNRHGSAVVRATALQYCTAENKIVLLKCLHHRRPKKFYLRSRHAISRPPHAAIPHTATAPYQFYSMGGIDVQRTPNSTFGSTHFSHLRAKFNSMPILKCNAALTRCDCTPLIRFAQKSTWKCRERKICTKPKNNHKQNACGHKMNDNACRFTSIYCIK